MYYFLTLSEVIPQSRDPGNQRLPLIFHLLCDDRVKIKEGRGSSARIKSFECRIVERHTGRLKV